MGARYCLVERQFISALAVQTEHNTMRCHEAEARGTKIISYSGTDALSVANCEIPWTQSDGRRTNKQAST
jgi:hypothetical protein